MTMHLEQRGPDITRDQLKDVCAALGYDASDVRSIHADGKGPVIVEAFLRSPAAGSERGVRVSSNGYNAPYAYVRITHEIAPSARAEVDSPQTVVTEEFLARTEDLARRGLKVSPLALLDLTAEIRRLKEEYR